MADPAGPVRLTFAELAERWGISIEAARTRARRRGWESQRGNDGRVTVLVDRSELTDLPDRGSVATKQESITTELRLVALHDQIRQMEIRAVAAEALAAELPALRGQLAKAQERAATAEAALAEIRTALADAKATLAREQGVADRQRQELGQQRQDVTRLQREVTDLQLQLARPWWSRLLDRFRD